MKQKMMYKTVYARNAAMAMRVFRLLTPDKYTAMSAKYEGMKNGRRTYEVKFRLKKGEY